MITNIPDKVDKKGFFNLLYKFMLENRIHQEWFKESKEYKLGDCGGIVHGVTFLEDDDFKTHLEKSIKVYTIGASYNDYIYGFFRYIPSCFDYHFYLDNGTTSKWGRISDKWENKYSHTKLKR